MRPMIWKKNVLTFPNGKEWASKQKWLESPDPQGHEDTVRYLTYGCAFRLVDDVDKKFQTYLGIHISVYRYVFVCVCEFVYIHIHMYTYTYIHVILIYTYNTQQGRAFSQNLLHNHCITFPEPKIILGAVLLIHF